MIKETTRRHHREQTQSTTEEHQTIDDKFKYVSSGTLKTGLKYLVESFSLNSVDRVVSRKGYGRRPDPSFSKKNRNGSVRQLLSIAKCTGRKVKDIDLEILESTFKQYVEAVNLTLERVYKNSEYAEELGKTLSQYRGRAYNFLRGEPTIRYQNNQEVKRLVYERLHRNALEQAGRIILTDWTRRQLIDSAIKYLSESSDNILSLLRKNRIPSYLIRKVRDSCEPVKNNGAGYHYALGVLRQLRFALDRHLLDNLCIKIRWRGKQRSKISSLLKTDSPEKQSIISIIVNQVQDWKTKGYPFTIPKLKNYSLDFSASTENSVSQGYWFSIDQDRENEILLHLKLPPGIDGVKNEHSPYKSKTLTFRFLNWLPRACSIDRRKADDSERKSDALQTERLRFRAAKFEDMHRQLMNTIEFQHVAYRLSKMRTRKESDSERVFLLQEEVNQLKAARRSAPPRLLLRGDRVTLQIPFLSPNGEVSSSILGEREYDTHAGVDRGIRAPVALSVEKEASFEDLLITVGHLVEKRERLRRHASKLTSELDRKKNNWEKKRSGQSYPAPILKRDRHVSALWRKFRRLDREIARQVASRTVWFCEEHRVRKLFFEDLRSFQPRAGMKNLSWFLGVNLWGKIIETVRYMRESLGHSKYSVWTVNPRYTSQTCHQCNERGIRVEDEKSNSERKGGEFFYCSKCDEHFHADINAARNIIHVQQSSVVPGRTT
jgi:hypothetical protein